MAFWKKVSAEFFKEERKRGRTKEQLSAPTIDMIMGRIRAKKMNRMLDKNEGFGYRNE